MHTGLCASPSQHNRHVPASIASWLNGDDPFLFFDKPAPYYNGPIPKPVRLFNISALNRNGIVAGQAASPTTTTHTFTMEYGQSDQFRAFAHGLLIIFANPEKNFNAFGFRSDSHISFV
jgi:hypothetical protein